MPNLQHIQAILFDMDGLLFDTERLRFEFYQAAAKEYGEHFPAELYAQLIGLRREESQPIVKRHFSADVSIQSIKDRRNALYHEHIDQLGVPKRPGADAILAAVQQKSLKSAIASSSFKQTIEDYLTRTPLNHRFDAIVAGDDIQNGKPAPDIFLHAAKAVNVLPQHCLVLEDSPAGIKAANAAGMEVIWIPDFVAPSPDISANCLAVLPSLNEVAALF